MPRVTFRRLILAYHSIFSTYGFWLPNDPRGSWSDYVRRWELFCHGAATKTTARRSLAHDQHDQQSRVAAKRSLRLPAVLLTGRQALTVGRGFQQACKKSGYVLFACSILPQHVHVVVARARYRIERVVAHLKGAATTQLADEGLHPFAGQEPLPSPWVRRGWNVFLDNDAAVRRAIRYVEENPLKEGKRRQNWSFVTPYDS